MNAECIKNDNFKEKNKTFSSALVFGGQGYERDVSRLGAVGFLNAANKLKIDLLPIYIDKDGNFFVYSGGISQIAEVEKELPKSQLTPTYPVKIFGKSGFLLGDDVLPIERAFLLLHGDYGEDGIIQGALKTAGISFFGSETLEGALLCDKAYTKIVASYYGVKTLPFLIFKKGFDLIDESESEAAKRFGYPLFIKPANLGSSVGASVAKCKQEFIKSIENGLSVSDKLIIEPAIEDKREIECAYFNLAGRNIISTPGEVLTGGKFYDYNLKYSKENAVSAIPSALLSKEEKEAVMQYAGVLADAFSVRHIARFDFFLTADSQIYFNEVNTMPGMTASSLYSLMLEKEGIAFEEFIKLIFKEKW